MGFFDFFSNYAESKERHPEKSLTTHYYKNNYKAVKEALLNYARQNKLHIKTEDDTHGELFLTSNSHHIICTIVELNPRETAVDLKVQTYKLAGLNRPKKLVAKTFTALDESLSFKGFGLHP